MFEPVLGISHHISVTLNLSIYIYVFFPIYKSVESQFSKLGVRTVDGVRSLENSPVQVGKYLFFPITYLRVVFDLDHP